MKRRKPSAALARAELAGPPPVPLYVAVVRAAR
jgi:hypothetical protein